MGDMADMFDGVPCLGEQDEECIWVTRDGKEIEYENMTTEHIQNVISFFKFEREDMPNLFEELDKRLKLNFNIEQNEKRE